MCQDGLCYQQVAYFDGPAARRGLPSGLLQPGTVNYTERERMGEEAWTEHFEQSVAEFREQQGYELVSESVEIVERLRRKPQAS